MTDKEKTDLENLQARLSGEAPESTGMVEVQAGTIRVTVKELREVITKAAKGCEVGRSYTKAVKDLPDSYSLVVEKLDLEACLAGACCRLREIQGPEGSRIQTKVIDNPPKTKAPMKKAD